MPSKHASGKPAPLWVWVYLPLQLEPTLCGRFELSHDGGRPCGSFVYGQSYLGNKAALALDPLVLPLQDKVFQTVWRNGWFGVFQDSAPDTWGRRLIDRRHGPQDEMGYLLKARGQTVGALAFSDATDRPPASKTIAATPQSLEQTLQLYARVEGGEELTDEENEMLLGQASSGGARPKLTIEDEGTLWLAKGVSIQDNPDYAPVPCVEGALLTVAQQCGICVPRHSVIQVAGKPVLLVERFDRTPVQGGYSRWRYASAQTLFWGQPEVAQRSYQGSYTNLARRLRLWERRPTDSVRELYRRIVFNALIGNTDDHDKNHGVVATVGGDFALSPAFDLTIDATTGARQSLQMAFGSDGALITLKNLLSECDAFGYPIEEAQACIRDQWRTIRTLLAQAIEANGAEEACVARTISRMPGQALFAGSLAID